MSVSVACREELERARQERVQLTQRWLDGLEAFAGDDATLMRVRGEQPEHVAELAEVAEALPDDLLRDAKPDGDRVFGHTPDLLTQTNARTAPLAGSAARALTKGV